MPDASALIAALIRARRAGDVRAATDTLARLRQRGFRLDFGSSLPPRRYRPAADAPPRANT